MKTKKTIFLLAGLMYFRQMDKTLTFREITTCDELEKAFRFRYEEYSKCRMNVFLQKNEDQLDIDSFDLHSRHYGLFNGDDELIGYVKVVLDRHDFLNREVFEVGKRHGYFTNTDLPVAGEFSGEVPDYPFLSYNAVPVVFCQYYNSLKRKKEQVLEASRLILKEGYRGLKNISFLVECAIMLYIRIYPGYRYAIADCVKEHARFYQRYGFLPVDQSSDFGITDLKRKLTCLSLELSMTSIPSNFHPRFDEMAFEYGQFGRVTRYLG